MFLPVSDGSLDLCNQVLEDPQAVTRRRGVSDGISEQPMEQQLLNVCTAE